MSVQVTPPSVVDSKGFRREDGGPNEAYAGRYRAREGISARSERPSLRGERRPLMEVLHACCCGLEAHKKGVTACVLWAEGKGKTQKEKRQFGTMTRDLLLLADWLQACG
jgi:hypothetical protein